MRINEIRKSIIFSSSDDFIEDISNHLINGSFIGKNINDIREIFASSHNNQSERNIEDYKYFYDKVAYVDFCNFNNMAHTKLAAKKYLAATFNTKTREFTYSSNKFHKSGDTPLETILVLNVKGSDIYKVLTSIYTTLRDNGIDNSITIPSFNRFQEGVTDSIRININLADLERVVNLIGDLPLPIINLMDKPNMLYPRVNDYIGYDSYTSLDNIGEIRESVVVCQCISDALFRTVISFLDRNGDELIENGGETILQFRKNALDNNLPLVEADLRILQRMVKIAPSNRTVFFKNLKDALLGRTNTKSAYISKEDNDVFDQIYGKLIDESILFANGSLELKVATPVVLVEGEQKVDDNTTPNAANDLLVVEEQPTDLMVKSDESTDLLVPDDSSKELLVKEPIEEKKEDSLYDEFMKREPQGEGYLDRLLAGMTGENKTEEPQESTLSIGESKDTSVQEDNIHIYQNATNLGDNFVVTQTQEAGSLVEGIKEEAPFEEEDKLVSPEDLTEEQKELIRDTYAELPEEDSRFFDYLEEILYKTPADGAIEEPDAGEGELPEETLSSLEIQSLSSNPLDQQMTFERALKYKDLVYSISILNTKVKGTDFTLLDYFDQQQLLSRIKPNSNYMTITDEVYDGLGVVENCIIKYVSHYGNVPLDKILEEYGIEELAPVVSQSKPKGFKGIFKRKRS